MAEECRPQTESQSWTASSVLKPVQGQAEEIHSSAHVEQGNGVVSARTTATADFAIRRATSTDFKSNGAVDEDATNTVEEGLFMPARPPRQRGRSLLAEIAAENEPGRTRPRQTTDAQPVRYDPLTGRPLARVQSARVRRAQRHPLLQTAVDEQVRDEEVAEGGRSPIPSSTSASTISPPFEPVQTPRDPGDEYLKSPLDLLSSPISIPDGSSFARAMSPRSKSYQISRTGSSRRVSRRSSTRVGSSSFSPASAFLSQYRDENASQPEPDDEGQEIGDNSEYIIGRQIGFGGFSVVKEVFTIENDEKVRRAVKIVRKQITGQSEQDNENVQNEFEHEVSIWRYLKHRYILPLHAVFENAFATYCIIQFNAGGTLFDLIRRQRKTASFVASAAAKSQPAATSPRVRAHIPLFHLKRYMYQIASALRYLHQDMRIVHRDLKLENCLLDTKNSFSQSLTSLSDSITSLASLPTDPAEAGDILLCDFGMADFFIREDRDAFRPSSAHSSIDLPAHAHAAYDGAAPSAPQQSHNIGPGPTSANIGTSTNIAGSLQYAAPELIRASRPLYDPSVDMWAYGVVCFALLTGELPFAHGLAPKVQARILAGDWDDSLLREAVGRALRAAVDGDASTDGVRADVEVEVRAAMELVGGCLDMDPRSRWDVSRVLECDFLAAEPGAYERGDGYDG